MANNHYVPRFLTKPWEFDDRRLRVFDFCTQAFSSTPSKSLFAAPGLNSARLELWFNEEVETPMAEAAAKVGTGAWESIFRNTKVNRAFALLFLLNSPRLREAKGIHDGPFTLEHLAGLGETFIEQLASYFFSTFRVFQVELPQGLQLYFSESVVFPYPVLGRPLLGLPLGLRHAVFAYDGTLTTAEVEHALSPELLTALSWASALRRTK